MRRLAAVLLVSTVLLAGCSSTPTSKSSASASASASTSAAPSAAPTASAADVAALAAVKVTPVAGAAPKLDFTKPFEVKGNVVKLDAPGTGAELKAGLLVKFHFAQFSGTDGKSLTSTWTEGTPANFVLGDPSVISELTNLMTGQKVGSRFLLATPARAAVAATDTAAAEDARPSGIMAIEVTDVLPAKAAGKAVTPPAGLPAVTLADTGAPSIKVPAGAKAPTKLVAQTLITGAGKAVKSGQAITVQYSGWLWDGTAFDSSWESGSPFTTLIGKDQVVKGWDQGLVGKTVGSQVLLVIPPALGYGDKAAGSIPAGSTLVFVVDILDAS